MWTPKNPAGSFELVRGKYNPAEQPFTTENVPITIRAKAKRIPRWTQDKLGLVGKLPISPVASDQPEETVTLIPMGAARLRITAFPVIGQPNDASVHATIEVRPRTAGLVTRRTRCSIRRRRRRRAN